MTHCLSPLSHDSCSGRGCLSPPPLLTGITGDPQPHPLQLPGQERRDRAGHVSADQRCETSFLGRRLRKRGVTHSLPSLSCLTWLHACIRVCMASCPNVELQEPLSHILSAKNNVVGTFRKSNIPLHNKGESVH